MGQGQMEIALDLLKKSSAQGSWVCLKNLHLVTPWLTTLEKVMPASIEFSHRTSLFLLGIECLKASQRFSTMVDLGKSSKISNNSSSVKH